MAASKSLIFEIFGKDVSATASLRNIEKSVGSLRKSFVSLAGTVGLVFGAEKVLEFGKDAVSVAEGMQKAQANLRTAVKNSGAQWTAYSGQIEKASDKGRTLGFTNEDTAAALATLTTSLKSPKLALKDLGIVQDLARTKNMDLASAALLVAKASEGQIRPLKALGIDLNVTAGGAAQVAKAQQGVAAAQKRVNDILGKYPSAARPASKAHKEYQDAVDNLSKAQDNLNAKSSTGQTIMDELAKRLGGQAAAATDTEAGKMDVLNAKIDQAKEKIGNGLLKSLGAFADWATSPSGGKTIDGVASGITGIVDAIANTPNPIATLTGGVAGLAVSFWALDAAMDNNPIGWIVLGFEAAAAEMTGFVTNVGGVQTAVVNAISGVLSFARGIQLAIDGVFESLINGVIWAINRLLIPLNDLLVAAGQKPVKLGNVDLTSGLKNGLLPTVSAGNPINVLGASSGGGGGGASRKFATGAIVRATPGGVNINGTFAEAGHDELIMPLTQKNMATAGMGNKFYITTPDPVGAANAVVRRLNAARS